jgi:hypothetical protein
MRDGRGSKILRFNNGVERGIKEWFTLPYQGGRKEIYNPRKKTNHLSEFGRHKHMVSSAMPTLMTDGLADQNARLATNTQD